MTLLDKTSHTSIIGACQNNLKNIDVSFPHNKITVITGVSGSGKSSLAYNVIYRESLRRYFESLSGFTGKFFGKLEKPHVTEIKGLQSALVVNQRRGVANPRSTVGTLSDIYDYLRMLFARCGKAKCIHCGAEITDKMATECHKCKNEKPPQLASLFSFNSVVGACDECNGLGITEKIDVDKLIADENLTLREGALVPTTPTGYIVYSQVTVDSLNEVCKAHDFSVDIPWKELTDVQKNVILYGSDRVKILFGKHSLESRLRWKGITAKPREEGYYKGMIPIMTDILKRDRNDNILRFASSFRCDKCDGARLRKEALNVTVTNKTISEIADMTIKQLGDFISAPSFESNKVIDEIIEPINNRIKYLQLLGLGYLSCSRLASSLSGGEYQRIKLAQQVGSGLQNILYILDEPSAGLHMHDNDKLISVLKTLRDNGNTVLVAEHERNTIKSADYIIDIGPEAGINGGELLFEGIPDDLINNPAKYPRSITAKVLREKMCFPKGIRSSSKVMKINNACCNNLTYVDAQFKQNALNVVTGVSGAGKSTLVHEVLAKYLTDKGKNCESVVCDIPVARVIEVNQSPIGRTSRSNPATYTDIFTHIRNLFAKQPESIKRKYKPGRFSFNNKGGRCEKCEGAGVIQLGMHFLGNVDIKCDACDGRRFNDDTLEITYKGKNIFDILNMSVNEAFVFFSDQQKIRVILEKLIALGVGYLKLGQPSTTLSGGEAQRIKLASELYKVSKGHNLYILDEPTLGLHVEDVKKLILALNEIVDNNNTVIVIEHDPDMIINADHIIDLGPESGEEGGKIVFSGTVKELISESDTLTAMSLKKMLDDDQQTMVVHPVDVQKKDISFQGVTTNNLRNINVSIPTGEITVITGVSGSGKSSLAFDTIYSESRNRFTESFSTYARRMMQKVKKPDMEQCSGLTPAVMIDQSRPTHNPRSTVATVSGIFDHYRLLFSRAGKHSDGSSCEMLSSLFSYNNKQASCDKCNGLGVLIMADPKKFITDENKPITAGAMLGTVPGKFFGDSYGMYVNTLLEVGTQLGIDFNVPFIELDENAQQIALYGTSDREYDVSWEFKRGNRSGTHNLTTTWKGFIDYFTEEYEIRKNTKRGDAYAVITSEFVCDSCMGKRYKPHILDVKVNKLDIAQLIDLSVDQSYVFIEELLHNTDYSHLEQLLTNCLNKLHNLMDNDLGYLNLSRITSSLSGGESQRLRMANQLANGLTGITYILDEPTAGLHSTNTHKLLNILSRLKELGNTVIIVEHDPQVIKFADNIIDMGPGAGDYGGEIIASGSPVQIIENPSSITGKWLALESRISSKNRDISEVSVSIKGAIANNLKNIDVNIPKGCISVLSGVSGSGKSSLAFDVIADSFNAGKPINCTKAIFNNIVEIKTLSQDKIVTSPLSTVLSWCGVMDAIRAIFANQESAKALGFKKSHFSSNGKDGKCEACKGVGAIKVSLDFLSDVWVTCDECGGTGYKGKILKVLYKGKNISEILEMEISELNTIFSDNKNIVRTLNMLSQVGLGYLKAGQRLNTLSGGELLRLALAREIISENTSSQLFILDEPTTGLHMADIEKLSVIFHQLADKGNTLLIIEHNTDIINMADYVIELGPVGGDRGGYRL